MEERREHGTHSSVVIIVHMDLICELVQLSIRKDYRHLIQDER